MLIAAVALMLVATQAPAANAKDFSIAESFGRDVRALTAWRVYASADGESHVEKVTLPAKEAAFFGIENGRRTFLESKAEKMSILSVPPNVELAARPVPGRSMVLILRGTAKLGVSDGQRIDIGPGSLLIFEDSTGKGHSGNTGPEGYTALTISFPEQPK